MIITLNCLGFSICLGWYNIAKPRTVLMRDTFAFLDKNLLAFNCLKI